MAGIEPFHVMELLARAKALEAQGRSIVHMEIGEPDFPTPAPVCEAGIRALRQGDVFYTSALGMPELREAIAAYYATRYGVEIDPARVIVTAGSSGALLLALAVLVDPQSEILLPDPGYPANRHFVRLLNGEPVNVPVGADSRYQLTAELIERCWTDRTVGALVATPSNPTGTLIADAELRNIRGAIVERGGALIVDEIYHGLVYGEHPRTALAHGSDIFVINSFSKYFSMTGWRLGWMIAPEPYLREIDKLAQNIYLSPPTTSQRAGLAALQPETLALLDERRDAFRSRRDYLVPALRRLGFEVPQMPEGAFYVYADCSRHTQDSFQFSKDLLELAGVAITPGIDFGRYRAARHVRFAYTSALEKLQEGIARIERFLS
jgi:aspartate/methionine/tyrosine aminotransferase